MKPVLSVENLHVRYDDYRALDDVSVTVAQGESFGLVGESGSGKSTLLRAVAGLAPVREGTIHVDGQALKGSRRPRSFFRKVQMVFQDPYGSLHPRQTVDRWKPRCDCLRSTLSAPGQGTRNLPGSEESGAR